MSITQKAIILSGNSFTFCIVVDYKRDINFFIVTLTLQRYSIDEKVRLQFVIDSAKENLNIMKVLCNRIVTNQKSKSIFILFPFKKFSFSFSRK